VKSYYAYVRVSTARQGVRGVSLQEQKAEIEKYAARQNLQITEWFEDRQTAAKLGRRRFGKMLSALRRRRVDGVIIHKIDRSARNLRDWADLGELIDRGIEVHFAHDALDLRSRGGRLSADIQAVVAADYIRNLREEAVKGLRGRLKQGLYPFPAPIGYLDCGEGKVKMPDPKTAPLVQRIFELYASGKHAYDSLVVEAAALGLRNRRGGEINRTNLTALLNNPFYAGVILIKRTGETYPGKHQPIISVKKFEEIQLLLRGRSHSAALVHDYLFRRQLTCVLCKYSLIGERQKGHVYYRCHSKDCPTKCVREEAVEAALQAVLGNLELTADERMFVASKIEDIRSQWESQYKTSTAALRLQIGQLDTRLDRLTDAYVDGLIGKDVFESRKARIVTDRVSLEQRLAAAAQGKVEVVQRVKDFLAFAGNAASVRASATFDEAKVLLKTVTSNRLVEGENVVFIPAEPFLTVANRSKIMCGGPESHIARTWEPLLNELLSFFIAHPELRFDSIRSEIPRENEIEER
jgi:site-specific DNA recombinase